MACFLLLVNLFIVVNAEVLTIKINNVWMKQTNKNASMAIIEYYFYDNELAEVRCTVSDTSMMRLEVPEEPRLKLNWTNTTDITILIRMRKKNTNNYIDCYHKSDVQSIVRIKLIQDINEDEWQIRINQKVLLRKNPEYKYIHDERINVTCKKNLQYDNQSSGEGFFKEGYPVKNKYDYLKCPKYEGILINFNEMDINGLQGLSSSNILFLYKTSDYLAIHYEYDGVQTLNVEWQVKVIAEKSNEYKVFWKDSLVTSLPVMTTQNDCNLKLTINPIIISGEDDHSIIKFTSNVTDYSKSELIETRIFLRQSVHNIVPDQKVDVGNVVYIAIGVLCILMIILIASTLIIIKNKLKTQRNVTEENNYINLDKESSSIAPFPSQWEAYANTMVRTEPDMKIIQQLYAKPLPKSQRIKPDETNTGSSDVDEALYSEIQEFEPMCDPKAFTMDRKDKNSYINLNK